jgi:hypothetical protein
MRLSGARSSWRRRLRQASHEPAQQEPSIRPGSCGHYVLPLRQADDGFAKATAGLSTSTLPGDFARERGNRIELGVEPAFPLGCACVIGGTEGMEPARDDRSRLLPPDQSELLKITTSLGAPEASRANE